MLGTMYRWCVAAFSNGLGNIPTPIDQVLDDHVIQTIVWAAVATGTAYREEIQPHIAPAMSTRTIGNCLLVTGLRSCAPLARLPLTPQHCQAWLLWCVERVDWRVEWLSVVFSDESIFCLYASDGRKCVWHRPGERHLLKCIRPWHTGPTSDLMVWGSSVTTRSHIWCFCKVK